MNSVYGPGEFNVGSMFVNPTQMAAFDVQERNSQFQAQWMRNQIEAMPAPWAEDLKQFVYRALAAYSGTGVPENPYSSGDVLGDNTGGAGVKGKGGGGFFGLFGGGGGGGGTGPWSGPGG